MIKGTSKHKKFLLQQKGNEITFIGEPSAFFGYKLGEGTSENNDGIWVEWKWENDHFELKNSRYGFYPIFYYIKKDGLGVSPSIFDLTEQCSPTELDDAAIAVFLRLGFYIGDDTPFKKIRSFPPGSKLSWGRNKCGISSNIRIQTRKTSLSREAAVKEYGKLFQSVIEKCFSPKDETVAFPLSGGRDSRHILFALARSNFRPDRCVTVRYMPPVPDEDTMIASQVAQHLNIAHDILIPPRKPIEAELRKNMLTSLCVAQHAWQLPLREYLKQHSFTIAYDGIGGGVLSVGAFLNHRRLDLYRDGKLKELAEDILGSEGYLPKLLLPPFYERWNRSLALSHLIPELEKHSDRPNPVGQFYFWNRTRRAIAPSPWSILNDSCHVLAPYLCEEVYDFLVGLPASYFLEGSFHTDAINAYYPEYAHLPYETKTLPRRKDSRLNIASFFLEATRHFFFSRSSANYIDNVSFLLPRLMMGLVNGEYGTGLPDTCKMPIYLKQLANVVTTQ